MATHVPQYKLVVYRETFLITIMLLTLYVDTQTYVSAHTHTHTTCVHTQACIQLIERHNSSQKYIQIKYHLSLTFSGPTADIPAALIGQECNDSCLTHCSLVLAWEED